MKLIVGLGNPGKDYEKTRHNSGYMAVDRLADQLGISINTSKFQALIATTFLHGEKVLLMKPLTFMNLSGTAVRAAVDYYHIEPEDILVIHDDMDLPVGSVRIRPKGSSGGQKGMKHIISCLGTDAIARIRIGVGHSRKGKHDEVPDWVLSPVPKAEQAEFETSIDTAAKAAKAWVKEPMDKVMSGYNRKVKTEKEEQ
ncbi:MAG: aminoacyl-tRNA hydrolase [Solobacterium sp.]|nr:aminoacyl-tRNA hydrolase [Solobacterium sp.]